MKTITKIIIALLVAVVAVVGVLVYLGYIDLPNIPGLPSGELIPDGATQLQTSDIDKFTALDGITTKNLTYNDIVPYFSTLDLTSWCSPLASNALIQWYDAELAADGYTIANLSNPTIVGQDWVVYLRIWTRSDEAFGLIVGEGATVQLAYGCTPSYMMGNGQLSTFEQFFAQLR